MNQPNLDRELLPFQSSDQIAIGYIARDGNFEFPTYPHLVRKIAEHYELSLVEELEFFKASGKAGEIYEVPSHSEALAADRILLVGLGDQSLTSLRSAGASIGRKVRGKAIETSVILSEEDAGIKASTISLHLGAYQWSVKTDSPQELPTFSIVTTDSALVEKAEIIAQAVCRARDLIHTPSNIKNPEWLSQEARTIAADSGVRIKVLSGKELKEFGGLRAVGNSSPDPGPRFVELSYRVEKGNTSRRFPHVVIVGKGITFDTGGVSLKRPYDLMTAMKTDMSGAAAALSTISALSDLDIKVNVTVLLMLAENALSGTSQRPSDVITHYGGTTVEVINTDAEGRLVLADGLAYADKNLDPDYLVDIATLTGAATLGLSRHYGAMYTRNKDLAEEIFRAGERSGDRIWHMPLIDDYQDSLESALADYNHDGSQGDYSAGSVTAALFLEKFVGNRTWVHLDIAGPARSDSDSGETPKGGTGFGVRLLLEWLASLS